MGAPVYDTDFYARANRQAALLRDGRWADADMARIAAEIEHLGKAETRELIHRLAVLPLHLLTWHHQPERRGNPPNVVLFSG